MLKWLKIIRFIDERNWGSECQGPAQNPMQLGFHTGPGVF